MVLDPIKTSVLFPKMKKDIFEHFSLKNVKFYNQVCAFSIIIVMWNE